MFPKVRKYKRVDKSGLFLPVVPRMEDQDYLDSLKFMPCVITGITECDPAHIRWGLGGGMSRRPDDNRALPLYWELHRHWQHQHGEVRFWREHLTDELMMRALLAYADQLYRKNKGMP